jgi:hypothetical protein
MPEPDERARVVRLGKKYLHRSMVLLALVFVPCQGGILGRADTVFQRVLSCFSFLPEYYLQTDLGGFALQKDEYFRQQRLAEWNTSISFILLAALKNRIQWVWDIDFLVGMGNIPGDIVFTILNASFGVDPSIKIDLNPLDIVTGLDHRCFHRVDRSDYGIVYWNRLFLETRSNNWRINEYWPPIGVERAWMLENRLSYRLGAGYYVKEFFGLVQPIKIDGNNNRFGEVYTDARYALYQRRSWVVVASGASKFGLFSSAGAVADGLEPYWQLEIGIESFFCRGKRGALFYSKYILDRLPRIPGMPDLSKDRLLHFGIKFFS